MTAHTCTRCTRTCPPSTYLCATCTTDDRTQIRLLADLAAYADDKRARVGTTWRFGTIGRSPETPLPYDPRITPIMTRLDNAVDAAVGLVMHVANPRVLAGASTAAALTWLAGMTHHLATHPDGPGLLDNLHAAGQRLVDVFDRPPERVYVGTCRADGCTEALYADRDHTATVVRCEKCTVEHPIADRRAELEAGVEDYLGTIKEISHLFRETFGEEVSIRRIYGYVDHGLIVARGTRVELDAKGRPRTSATFRIGDVRDAVRAMHEDKDAAKGVRRRERARATA